MTAHSGEMSAWMLTTNYGGLSAPVMRRERERVGASQDVPVVTTMVQLAASKRIVLPRDLRRAASVPRGQKLRASAAPGRIELEIEPAAHGRVVKRSKLKRWTRDAPPTPLAETFATLWCRRQRSTRPARIP
jgi:hypothetical protein